MKAKRKSKNALVPTRWGNGRLQRAAAEHECSPTEVKRLRDAAVIGLRDEQWGTVLGRLFLEAKIDAVQFAAGKWWAMMAQFAGRSILEPDFPSKTGFIPRVGGKAPDPDSERGQEDAKAERDAAELWRHAHSWLITAGILAEQMVRRLCEDDKNPESYNQLMQAKLGLDRVAAFREANRDLIFELTRSKRAR